MKMKNRKGKQKIVPLPEEKFRLFEEEEEGEEDDEHGHEQHDGPTPPKPPFLDSRSATAMSSSSNQVINDVFEHQCPESVPFEQPDDGICYTEWERRKFEDRSRRENWDIPHPSATWGRWLPKNKSKGNYLNALQKHLICCPEIF